MIKRLLKDIRDMFRLIYKTIVFAETFLIKIYVGTANV